MRATLAAILVLLLASAVFADNTSPKHKAMIGTAIIAKGYNCQGGVEWALFKGKDHRGNLQFCSMCANGLYYDVRVTQDDFIVIPAQGCE